MWLQINKDSMYIVTYKRGEIDMVINDSYLVSQQMSQALGEAIYHPSLKVNTLGLESLEQ